VAAHCGNVKMAKLLLENKCEVNASALVCLYECSVSAFWICDIVWYVITQYLNPIKAIKTNSMSFVFIDLVDG